MVGDSKLLSSSQHGSSWLRILVRNLADTQQRGSLDLPDFIIGMYYIQALMSNQITTLPAILPPGLYEQASGGRPRPPVAPASPIPRQMTGGASPAPGTGPLRQMSGVGG